MLALLSAAWQGDAPEGVAFRYFEDAAFVCFEDAPQTLLLYVTNNTCDLHSFIAACSPAAKSLLSCSVTLLTVPV